MEKKQISRFSSRRLFFLFDDVLAPFSFFLSFYLFLILIHRRDVPMHASSARAQLHEASVFVKYSLAGEEEKQ